MSAMRILCLLFFIVPQGLAAQSPTRSWLQIAPPAPRVGTDVTLFATVWAQTETPTGTVDFDDRGTSLGSAPLVPLPPGHGRIASGGGHSCAIGLDGTVWCWGFGGNRQLGNNSLANQNQPVMVLGLPGPVTQVAAGGNHTCAITETGELWCWGYNAYGQLGLGDIIQHFAPERVTAIGGTIAHVDTGENHTCAVTQRGDVYCWGRNLYGQIGDGTTTQRTAPVMVPGLPGRAASVATGESHSCVQLRTLRVMCWGRNSWGQLGDGGTTDSPVPVNVVGGRAAVMVALGQNHSCLLRSNGTQRCWGRNQWGQIGDGTTVDRLTPVRAFAGGRDIVDMDLGLYHTCAVRWQGRVRCWGRNPSGQLGDGTQTDQPDGVTTLLPSPVWAWSVSTSDNGGCAQGMDGEVRCWGYNANGATGDGTFDSPRLTPVATVGGAIAWPQAGAWARLTIAGGWSAGLRRIRALYAGTATLAASQSNRVDHRTRP